MSSKVDFGRLSEEFQPRHSRGRAVEPAKTPTPESWPSREPRRESQLSIKGAEAVIERFKNLCEDERYPYYKQLHRLMNVWEGKSPDDGVKEL